MVQRSKHILVLLTGAVAVMSCFWNSNPSGGQGPPESSALASWRSRDYSASLYTGSKACAECHASEAATQLATPMANALSQAADCRILSTRSRLTFRNGAYTYEIARQGKRSIYTVSDGTNSISEPILYCFGQGKVGQTYVFRHQGLFYETRLSYYQAIQKLDFTTRHPRTEPTSPEEALGRPLSVAEAVGCFACHSTASVNGDLLQLDHLIPGVTCEGCHGPGKKHIVAAKARQFKDLQIFNPGTLSSDTLSQEFCGTCHGSFDFAMLLPLQGGINNIRLQPYRMANSRGHKGDARISCLACHNPHNKLEHEAAFYDAKCLACHLANAREAKTKTRDAPACPVSNRLCVTCHMQKVEVPEMHSKFTDHWIRVVKPNEAPPN